MTRVARLHHDSWDEYKHDVVPELFGPGRFRAGEFLFRGCGDADWTLTPAFDRRFGALPTALRLDLWTLLLQSFRTACEQHGVPESILRDDSRLLAFGQHHDLPTRLLDWSLSPYVAAFFAFRQAFRGGGAADQVAIWVLDTRSDIWSAELGVELVAPPAIENVRLKNQAGRFTYSRTPYLALEDYVEHSLGTGRPLLQITLPRAEAERALPDLEMMGISAQNLFPDVLGLTEGVQLAVQLHALGAQREPRAHETPRNGAPRTRPGIGNDRLIRTWR